MKIRNLNESLSINLDLADIRDEIIFGEPFNRKEYFGGVRQFEKLTADQIDQLEKNDIINYGDKQNDAPTAREIINFVKKYPDEVTALGYVVSPYRKDFRITFTGVDAIPADGFDSFSTEFYDEFERLFGKADDLDEDDETGELFAWYS